MAWNPSPKVADCRDVARKWNVQQVVILGFNYKNGTFEIASFGETRALCADAKAIGEAIFKQIESGAIAPPPQQPISAGEGMEPEDDSGKVS
jgi:hypothetical protein